MRPAYIYYPAFGAKLTLGRILSHTRRISNNASQSPPLSMFIIQILIGIRVVGELHVLAVPIEF
jgi:hypothetical protein